MRESSDALVQADDLIAILRRLNEPTLLGAARLLHQRLSNPECFVCLIGETSSGKSSIINGLLPAPLLAAEASPTTGSVVHLMCCDVNGPLLFAINRDGTQEELNLEKFKELSRYPDENLLRLQARSRPAKPQHFGLYVFDTPGYNSIVEDHLEVLRGFLPQSDIIVFVGNYRSGFAQADQDLFELVQQCTEHDTEIVYLLVLNRVPEGLVPSSDEIRKIVKNASDSLLRESGPILIRTVDTSIGNPDTQIVPDSADLWDKVAEIAWAPERRIAVEKKIARMFADLAEEAALYIERRLLQARVVDEERAGIDSMLHTLNQSEEEAVDAIERSIGRLKAAFPPALRRERERIQLVIGGEIENTEKWLGKDDCLAWIQHHSLEYEAGKAGRSLEGLVLKELERLNAELDDIANTAVARIQSRIHIQSADVQAFAANLTKRIGMRVGGNTAEALLRGYGGVGGVAAGAGNLVKTAVRRTGDVFGKTFGREVYQQIGKIFTKKMVKALSVSFAVAIEGAIFIWDVHHWQNQFKVKVGEALNNWQDAIEKEFFETQLDEIAETNRAQVNAIFSGLIDEHIFVARKNGSSPDETALELEEMQTSIETIRTAFENWRD